MDGHAVPATQPPARTVIFAANPIFAVKLQYFRLIYARVNSAYISGNERIVQKQAKGAGCVLGQTCRRHR